MNDKNTKGAVAALLAALLYGGAEMLDHEARIAALEQAIEVPPSEEADAEEADADQAEEDGQDPAEQEDVEAESAEDNAEADESNQED